LDSACLNGGGLGQSSKMAWRSALIKKIRNELGFEVPLQKIEMETNKKWIRCESIF
jgi:hypothetical protein